MSTKDKKPKSFIEQIPILGFLYKLLYPVIFKGWPVRNFFVVLYILGHIIGNEIVSVITGDPLLRIWVLIYTFRLQPIYTMPVGTWFLGEAALIAILVISRITAGNGKDNVNPRPCAWFYRALYSLCIWTWVAWFVPTG